MQSAWSLCFIVLTLLWSVKSAHLSTCMTNVTFCPSGSKWEETGRRYNCSSGFVYVCMFSVYGHLYEGCTKEFFAKENGQCPRFTHCKDDTHGPILGGDKEYKECDEKDICPPNTKEKYPIRYIRKYPKCIGHIGSNSTYSRNAGPGRDSMENKPNATIIVVAIILPVILVAVIIFLVVLVVRHRRNERNRGESVNNEQQRMEDPSETTPDDEPEPVENQIFYRNRNELQMPVTVSSQSSNESPGLPVPPQINISHQNDADWNEKMSDGSYMHECADKSNVIEDLHQNSPNVDISEESDSDTANESRHHLLDRTKDEVRISKVYGAPLYHKNPEMKSVRPQYTMENPK